MTLSPENHGDPGTLGCGNGRINGYIGGVADGVAMDGAGEVSSAGAAAVLADEMLA